MPIYITDELDERQQLDAEVKAKAQQELDFPPAVLDLLLEQVGDTLNKQIPCFLTLS